MKVKVVAKGSKDLTQVENKIERWREKKRWQKMGEREGKSGVTKSGEGREGGNYYCLFTISSSSQIHIDNIKMS